jgi:hypothetical protein
MPVTERSFGELVDRSRILKQIKAKGILIYRGIGEGYLNLRLKLTMVTDCPPAQS